MKIDNTGKPLATSINRPVSGRATADKKAEAASLSNASVNSPAEKVQTQATASNTPAFDSEKVAAIRQAISEGKFTVRADAIADKLVSSVRELLEK